MLITQAHKSRAPAAIISFNLCVKLFDITQDIKQHLQQQQQHLQQQQQLE